MCKNLGIKLIEIPQFDDKFLTKYQLKDYIKSKCIELNIELPDNYDNIELFFGEIL